jgi:hypothetical protein
MGWLETAIKNAKDALLGVRKSLLKDIESDVAGMDSTGATPANATTTMEQIDSLYALLERVWKDDPEIKAHKEQNIPAAKKGYDRVMKQVAKNKMPKSTYAGGNKAELEKSIAAAYKERYATDEVLRVVITSAGWQEKTEISDDNIKLQAKTYLYISAHVAVKHGDTANVFVLSFRKLKSGGAIELGGVGNSYPVLMTNINK